jgi:hypothetical protein
MFVTDPNLVRHVADAHGVRSPLNRAQRIGDCPRRRRSLSSEHPLFEQIKTRIVSRFFPEPIAQLVYVRSKDAVEFHNLSGKFVHGYSQKRPATNGVQANANEMHVTGLVDQEWLGAFT